MSMASFVPDLEAVVQDFDAWHLAMQGAAEHERTRQRRRDAIIAQQIEEATRQIDEAGAFYGPAREILRGPLTIEPHADFEGADFR